MKSMDRKSLWLGSEASEDGFGASGEANVCVAVCHESQYA